MKHPMFVCSLLKKTRKKKTDYDANISDIENKYNVKISNIEKNISLYSGLQ